METRHTTRSYHDKTVPQAAIQKILGAAVKAPSSMNQQPWHFIVVNAKDAKAKIRRLYDQARKELNYYEQDTSFMENGALVVVCCNSAGDDQRFSCLMAAQNMLIAATALGLGSGPSITLLQSKEGAKKLRRLLGIPKKIAPLLLVTLGYTDKKPAHYKKKKGLKKVLHENRW
ncbi:MAG TPA: hypothetical protein HA252_01290 [Candidatus Diapherotrites archaeon]|nr:hypothetical protein [Candidatus Diapherotrites archaeon]